MSDLINKHNTIQVPDMNKMGLQDYIFFFS